MNLIQRNLSKFKLITFDVTDTLLKFKSAPAIQYAKTAAHFGYPDLDQSKIDENFKIHFRNMTTKYPNFGYNFPEIPSWQDWWRKLVKDVFISSDANIAGKDLDAIAEKLITVFETNECWLKYPHTDEIIIEIKKLNKTVGIISNTDPRVEKVLKNMKIPEIDFVLVSYDVGKQKPSKEIFDVALQKCREKILPYEALHIGNTAIIDYVGAKDSGWSSVLITNNKNDWKQIQNIDQNNVFDSLEQFLNALKYKQLNL